MNIGAVYDFLDEKAPFSLAEPWDNCGLLLGSKTQEIDSIVLSLDLSLEVLKNAPNGSLIITHHPFIFSGVKKLDTSSTVGMIAREAFMRDISIMAMHTNYDKAVLNTYFVKNVLGFENITLDNFVAKIECDLDFMSILSLLKNKLGLQTLEYVSPAAERIKSIGVTTGSGSEFAISSGVDLFLTGDIKYHTAFDAKERGIGLVDIKHYSSELCFAASLAEILNILPIDVIIANSKNPFEQC